MHTQETFICVLHGRSFFVAVRHCPEHYGCHAVFGSVSLGCGWCAQEQPGLEKQMLLPSTLPAALQPVLEAQLLSPAKVLVLLRPASPCACSALWLPRSSVTVTHQEEVRVEGFRTIL